MVSQVLLYDQNDDVIIRKTRVSRRPSRTMSCISSFLSLAFTAVAEEGADDVAPASAALGLL